MPSKQSIATRKYEAKTGWTSKTYKMKKKILDDFKAACDKAGVSQSGKLMEYMEQFIKEVNNK